MTKNTFFKALFLAMAFFCLTVSNAQIPQWSWAKKFTGIKTDLILSIAADNNGNIYAGGAFSSPTINFGALSLTNFQTGEELNGDAFISKLNDQGEVLWVKNIGGLGLDQIQSVITDHDNNVYVGGTFNSPVLNLGTTALTNTSSGSSFDTFIAKYSSDGNLLWAFNVTGGNYSTTAEIVFSLAVDSNNNLYATGAFSNPTLDFGNGIILTNLTGSHNVFIAKYNSNGEVLWAKSAGGSNNDQGIFLTVDNQDNVYLLGEFQSSQITFGATTLTNNQSNDIFIVKYNDQGDEIWAKSAGGDYYDVPISLVLDNNGHFYISGDFTSSSLTFGPSTLTNPNPNFSSLFIAKYDVDGNALWGASAISQGTSTIYDIALAPDGNLYATGSFGDTNSSGSTLIFPGHPAITSNGTIDCFLTKYDTNGNVLLVKQTGGTGIEMATTAVLVNDALYTAGRFSATEVNFDDHILSTENIWVDAFIAKLDLGILDTQEFAAQNLTVFPNPAKNVLNFSGVIENNTNYTITDITGRIVKSGALTNVIEVSYLPSGLYLLATNNGFTTKFIKE